MLLGAKFVEEFFKLHQTRSKKQHQYKQNCQGKRYTVIIRRAK